MVVALSITAIWAMALGWVNHERDTAIAAEIQKNSNLARSHEDRVTRSFDLLDQILRFLRADYYRNGLPKSLKEHLLSAQLDQQYLGIAAFIGPQGQLLATTGQTITTNYADREYFQFHSTDPTDRLLIGKPIIGRSQGKLVITLTRRINLPDGSFGGVVLLSIDPTFFAADYAITEQGPRGSMAIIGLDGITRARRNGDKISFGEDVKASQLFKELPKAANGYYTAVSASDGQKRVISYRSLQGYPMVTIVGSSLQDVLESSRKRESVYWVGAAVATFVVLVLALIYFITSSRRAQALSTIEQSERRYRLLFENSLDAVISTAPDGRVLAANPAACVMFARNEAALQQLHRSELFDQQDHRYAVLMEQEASKGKMQGTVTMVRSDGGRLEAEVSANRYPDRSQLSSMIIRDVSERKLAEDQIKNLAFFDTLTELPNRRMLTDRLRQALANASRHTRKGALLFIDLDYFKTLNDTLGHFMGDLLLQQVAKRLSTCFREGDTVARLGGDEFVVMLEALSENEAEAALKAESAGEKILATLGEPYLLGTYSYNSTPSVGITLFDADTENVDEPLKRADVAMYQAKSAGRNTLRFFNPAVQIVANRRLAGC